MADLLLKSIELRLLRCTLPPSQQYPSPNPNPNPLIEFLINAIERGNYSDALASPAAHLVFKFADSFEFEESVESSDRFYGEAERSVESFLRGNNSYGPSDAWLDFLGPENDEDNGESENKSVSEMDAELRFAIVTCLGVAALLAFVQQNVTG